MHTRRIWIARRLIVAFNIIVICQMCERKNALRYDIAFPQRRVSQMAPDCLPQKEEFTQFELTHQRQSLQACFHVARIRMQMPVALSCYARERQVHSATTRLPCPGTEVSANQMSRPPGRSRTLR
jgi:hypothetical protein